MHRMASRSRALRFLARLLAALLAMACAYQVGFIEPSGATQGHCGDQGPEEENLASTPNAYNWGDPATLEEHFIEHGPGVGTQETQAQYAYAAQDFLADMYHDPVVQVKYDEVYGVTRVRDPRTDFFAAYNRDTSTRTFYKIEQAKTGCPSEIYWAQQPGADPRPAQVVSSTQIYGFVYAERRACGPDGGVGTAAECTCWTALTGTSP